MEKKMKSLRGLLAVSLTMAGLLAGGAAAKADTISLNLTAAFQTGTPGETLTFDATAANLDPSDTIYLNSDSTSVSAPLALDDSPFFTNFPFYLNPAGTAGDSFTGELFSVFIPNGTADGLYTGSFEILGGGPSDFTDVVGTADFNVKVAATPEPPALLLLLSGLLVLAGVFRRRAAF
jgi:hypothetical protein